LGTRGKTPGMLQTLESIAALHRLPWVLKLFPRDLGTDLPDTNDLRRFWSRGVPKIAS
jgi:hypothetical protein